MNIPDADIALIANQTLSVAVLHALIANHPNPDGLLASWREFSAIARADWSSRAIALGDPGYGKETFSRVWEEWDKSLRVRASKK